MIFKGFSGDKAPGTKIKYLFNILPCVLLTLFLVACGGKNTGSASIINGLGVYLINSSITGLYQEAYSATGSVEEVGVNELIAALQYHVSSEGNITPLNGITVLSAVTNEGRLTLDLGREYSTITGIREVLTRAAVVKTLTQLEAVQEIEILVGGSPLTYPSGDTVGVMRGTDFVDYFGNEQDAINSENFIVYYATADDEGLIGEVHRAYFENSVSREQAALRYMLEDPETDGAKVAISPAINVINIATNDGICYLDMDMSFYNPEGSIPYNIALYAIVNTLCELEGIHSVQVNIIDSSESVMSDLAGSVSGLYEKNLDLVRN